MKNLYAPAIAIGLGILGVAASWALLPAGPSVNVTQHHNNASRDGLFIDPAFTPAAAANLTRDMSFNGTIVGNVYAQPLYIENGPGGAAMVIAVTESNNVYALNAATGSIIWQRNVGTPITSGLPCGNINPLGITGTPIVDLASRSLFFDAETTPTAGTFKHLIYSLNVDTGAINTGWPVDVDAAVSGFDSSVQSSRAALGIVGNIRLCAVRWTLRRLRKLSRPARRRADEQSCQRDGLGHDSDEGRGMGTRRRRQRRHESVRYHR